MSDVVATWKHRGGSTVTVTALKGTAYAVTADGAGGVIYAGTRADAIAQVQARVDAGWYSRDAWTTPYQRAA